MKTIFYIIIISLFTYLFADVIADTSIMITEGANSITSALNVILAILIVPFRTMLSYYYIKLALYLGVLIFALSYIFKWLTGHHLTTEEDVEEEVVVVQQNFLDNVEYKKVPKLERTTNIYSRKQTYDANHFENVKKAKEENSNYENELKTNRRSNNIKVQNNSVNNFKNELEEFRKRRKERSKKS